MKRSAIGIFNGNWKNQWKRDLEDDLFWVDLNSNHVNSDYWLERRNNALRIVLDDPQMEAIWFSDIVPDNATMMLHALLAEKIVSGELKLDNDISQDILKREE